MQLLEQTNQKEETETPEVQDQQVVPFEDTTTDVGKNPLVKKLQSIAIKNDKGGQMFLDASKQLLSANEAREKSILSSLGLNGHLVAAETAYEKVLIKNKHKEKFSQDIYTLEDIKSLALDYRLYFRSTHEYRGNIPNDLGICLSKLFAKHNLDTSQYQDGRAFFILAPPAMFKEYTTPKDKVKSFFENWSKDTKAWVDSQRDPVLFYKIDDNHYMLVKSWGKTFTPYRRALGFLSKNWVVNVLTVAILSSFVYAGLWLLIAGTGNIIHFFFPKEADISITRFIVGCLCVLINVAASLAFLISTVKYFVDSLSNFNTNRIEHISNFKISRRWFNKPY